ncbi:MAG: hypothetical protein HY332_10970 [Chloroflexi bacterium]|nr:hypothetical protein [Chloroflexota bacterium]
MPYLTLHIAGNAAFGLLVKAARARRFDYATVGLTNYATAALVAGVALFLAQAPRLGRPALDSATGLAALFGAINGLQYQTTYLLMYALLGITGIAVTTSFLRLSVAVPVLASIVIWDEWPAPLQALGLVLAGCALPLLGGATRRRASRIIKSSSRSYATPGAGATTGTGGTPSHGGAAAASATTLPSTPERAPATTTGNPPRSRLQVAVLVAITILVSGSGLLAAKAFAELHRPDQRPVYVLAVYVAATLLSLAMWPWRARFRSSAASSQEQLLPSIVLGGAIGVVNVAQIWLLLRALAVVPGVIAFPLAAAGGLAVTTLGGRLFWREPIGGRTGAGIVLAILAAALVNAH